MLGGPKDVPCPLGAGAGGREEEDGVLRGEGVEPNAVALREEDEDLGQNNVNMGTRRIYFEYPYPVPTPFIIPFIEVLCPSCWPSV